MKREMNPMPITFLVLVLVVVAFGAFLACRRPSADGGGPLDLQTLHASTFSKIVDRLSSVAVVFAGGSRALIAENNVTESRRLFLVDLEQGVESTIDLDSEMPMAVSELLYAGDAALAVFYSRRDVVNDRQQAFRIASDGSVRKLSCLESISVYRNGPPRPGSDDLGPLIESGRLSGLREIQKEICTWDPASQSYSVTEVKPMGVFFNDEYCVSANIESTMQRLRENVVETAVDPCRLHAPAELPGLRLELDRSPSANPGDSQLDGRILKARLYRGDALLHEYLFGADDDFYFYTIPTGGRLYFVGSCVRYLDLNTLPES